MSNLACIKVSDFSIVHKALLMFSHMTVCWNFCYSLWCTFQKTDNRFTVCFFRGILG